MVERKGLCPAGCHRQSQDGIQDFLALWKNADRDTQVLREAKAQYAKLQ
jgi:hypothetical protein